MLSLETSHVERDHSRPGRFTIDHKYFGLLAVIQQKLFSRRRNWLAARTSPVFAPLRDSPVAMARIICVLRDSGCGGVATTNTATTLAIASNGRPSAKGAKDSPRIRLIAKGAKQFNAGAGQSSGLI
jgi:hypothetical protein